jgi:hypothetical protein
MNRSKRRRFVEETRPAQDQQPDKAEGHPESDVDWLFRNPLFGLPRREPPSSAEAR